MRQKKIQLLSQGLTTVGTFASEELNVEGFDDLVIAVNATAIATGSAAFTIYHHFTYAGNDVWLSEPSAAVSLSAPSSVLAKVSGPFTDKIKISTSGSTFTGLSATIYVAGTARGIPGA